MLGSLGSRDPAVGGQPRGFDVAELEQRERRKLIEHRQQPGGRLALAPLAPARRELRLTERDGKLIGQQ